MSLEMIHIMLIGGIYLYISLTAIDIFSRIFFKSFELLRLYKANILTEEMKAVKFALSKVLTWICILSGIVIVILVLMLGIVRQANAEVVCYQNQYPVSVDIERTKVMTLFLGDIFVTPNVRWKNEQPVFNYSFDLDSIKCYCGQDVAFWNPVTDVWITVHYIVYYSPLEKKIIDIDFSEV